MIGQWQEASVHLKPCVKRGATVLGKIGRHFQLVCSFCTVLLKAPVPEHSSICKTSGMNLSFSLSLQIFQ